MRTFGGKKPNYFEFKLEGKEKIYRIPLAADMPFSILNDMNDAKGTDERFPAQIRMLRKYMGDDVDDLSAGTLSEILQAWGEESMKAGATLGES